MTKNKKALREFELALLETAAVANGQPTRPEIGNRLRQSGRIEVSKHEHATQIGASQGSGLKIFGKRE